MPGSSIAARRIASMGTCELEGPQTQKGTVWNLSIGGLYVVIDPPPEVGTTVRVAFSLPNEQRPVKAEARIAWRNPGSRRRGRGAAVFSLPPGCGLEFLVIDTHDRERIEDHVRTTPVLLRQSGWRRPDS
jgi:uncharacterized protein (TIGR02266 family)